jgi:hypothetical protein
MNLEEAKKRVLAAQELLNEQATTKAKFESVRTLIRGINPRIDGALNKCSKALTDLTKLQKGEVIELAAEHLPEDTEEKKKRKKALLLFIKLWKDLKGEVARVEVELKEGRHGQSSAQTLGSFGRILALAKGPLGIVTILAVAIAVLKFSEVEVVIRNRGCEPLRPAVSMPVRIPGLSLPSEPIPDGGQASAYLPPLKFTVDGSGGSTIRISAFGLHLDYELEGRGIDVAFNGESLIGKQMSIDFGSQKQHDLVVTCR